MCTGQGNSNHTDIGVQGAWFHLYHTRKYSSLSNMTSKSAAYGMFLQIYEPAVSILIVCIQADVRSLTRLALSDKKKGKKKTYNTPLLSSKDFFQTV